LPQEAKCVPASTKLRSTSLFTRLMECLLLHDLHMTVVAGTLDGNAIFQSLVLLAVVKQATRAGMHDAYVAHFAALPVGPGTASTHMIS
jgi:hypothetical protein